VHRLDGAAGLVQINMNGRHIQILLCYA
jgi:hypothetical protein